jgi:hypothetical protein
MLVHTHNVPQTQLHRDCRGSHGVDRTSPRAQPYSARSGKDPPIEKVTEHHASPGSQRYCTSRQTIRIHRKVIGHY